MVNPQEYLEKNRVRQLQRYHDKLKNDPEYKKKKRLYNKKRYENLTKEAKNQE